VDARVHVGARALALMVAACGASAHARDVVAPAGSDFGRVPKAVVNQIDGALMLPDGVDGRGDALGESVDMSPNGQLMIVGTPFDATRGPKSGTATVYRLTDAATNAWIVESVLHHPDALGGNEFGYRVAIDCATDDDGNDAECYAAVSARTDRREISGDTRVGSVSVFRRGSGWRHEALLTPTSSSGATQGCFGCAIDIDASEVPVSSGPIVVVGIPEAFASNSGNVIVFSRGAGDWSSVNDLNLDGVGPDWRLGTSVAVDWPVIVAGAPRGRAASDSDSDPAGGAVLSWMSDTPDSPPSRTSLSRRNTVFYRESGISPANAEFGHSVDVRAGRAGFAPNPVMVIGAPNAPKNEGNPGTDRTGVVYRFTLQGVWGTKGSFKLASDHDRAGARFGESVALAFNRQGNDPSRRHVLYATAPFADARRRSAIQTDCNQCGGVAIEPFRVNFGDQFLDARPAILDEAVGSAINDVAATTLQTSDSPVLVRFVTGYKETTAKRASVVIDECKSSDCIIGRDGATAFRPDLIRERGTADDPIHRAAGAPADRLGATVSVFGDLAAVGAPFVDRPTSSGPGTDVGAVYIFRRDASLVWRLEGRVQNPEFASSGSAFFGASVALGSDGDGGTLLVVGAPQSTGGSSGTNTGKGSVYVFRRNGSAWDLAMNGQQRLPRPPNIPYGGYQNLFGGDDFGFSVDVEKGKVVVGWPKCALGRTAADFPRIVGVAVVYAPNAEGQYAQALTVLTPPADRSYELGAAYGHAVAIDSGFGTRTLFERIAVSASGKNLVDVWSAETSAATSYAREATVTMPTARPAGVGDGGSFGDAIDLSDGVLAVADPNASRIDAGGTERPASGNVYIFRNEMSGWVKEVDAAVPSTADQNPRANAKWGTDLVISGNTLVLGAPGDSNRGAASVFRYAPATRTVSRVSTLGFPSEVSGDLGASVALGDAGLVVLGAPRQVVGAQMQGAAFTRESLDLVPATTDKLFTFRRQGTQLLFWESNVANCTLTFPDGSTATIPGRGTTQASISGLHRLRCGAAAERSLSVVVNPPVEIVSFVSALGEVEEGSLASLSWDTTAATACELDSIPPGDRQTVPADDTPGFLVQIDQTTRFVLRCTGFGGSVDEETLEVRAVPPTLEIVELVADPLTVVRAGDSATISWLTRNAESCDLRANDQLIVADQVFGSVSAPIVVDTRFELECTRGAQTSRANVTVSLVPRDDVRIVRFNASPLETDLGQTVELTWESSNATDCTLTETAADGVPAATERPVGLIGAEQFVALESVRLDLRCTNGVGQASASVDVQVRRGNEVFEDSFED
jgi:hypothetical protein